LQPHHKAQTLNVLREWEMRGNEESVGPWSGFLVKWGEKEKTACRGGLCTAHADRIRNSLTKI